MEKINYAASSAYFVKADNRPGTAPPGSVAVARLAPITMVVVVSFFLL
jgi:hypothetical protein